MYKVFNSASLAFHNGEIFYGKLNGNLTPDGLVGSADSMWRIFECPLHNQSFYNKFRTSL